MISDRESRELKIRVAFIGRGVPLTFTSVLLDNKRAYQGRDTCHNDEYTLPIEVVKFQDTSVTRHIVCATAPK